MYSYINDQLVTKEDAYISIEDRGFRFGDGVFETIRIYQGIPYQWELHQQRLSQGLDIINIKINLDILLPRIRELIAKNNINNGIVRLTVTRGIGSHGYLPTNTNPTIVIETTNVLPPTPDKINMWLSTLTKPSLTSMPVQHKLMQGLNSTLARMEAVDHECFDAILLNDAGKICECSSGNIFWIKNDTLYTSDINCGVLAGTTRAAILRLSPFKTYEGNFYIKDLLEADEVFATNVAWQILPVNALLPHGKQWNTVEKTQQLQNLLIKDIEDYVATRST